jgi:hypothetical protein
MVRPASGVQVFVEGAPGPALSIECRRAFSKLLDRADFCRARPTFIACGSRQRAFEKFVSEYKNAACNALLLVDSEGPVSQDSPWDHVRQRVGDGWTRPAHARDEDLHFMVECMESWIVADRDALRSYYGKTLQESALPARPEVEDVPKRDLYEALKRATRQMGYGKGADSFKLLMRVDPRVLRDACPWAERFFVELERRSPARRG